MLQVSIKNPVQGAHDGGARKYLGRRRAYGWRTAFQHKGDRDVRAYMHGPAATARQCSRQGRQGKKRQEYFVSDTT
jgi:hypothetical protein